MSKQKPASPNDNRRLERYRPWLDRLIFGVALLGMLLVVHLFLQEQRSFAGGCTGFLGGGSSAGAFDCAAVTQSAASDFLGVSNILWGFLFYTAVAALTAGAAFLKGWRLRLKQGRAALIVFGFGYSIYLTLHQFVTLDAFCVLCLGSAGLATVLFALQAADFFTSPSQSAATAMSFSGKMKREGAVLAALAVLFVVLAGADWAYFRQQPVPASATPAIASAATAPTALDSLDLPAGCRFSRTQAPVENYERLIYMSDPAFGPADAPVTVIEFLDPNCPHCKSLYPVMEQLMATYGDGEARFVFKPMPIWNVSIQQVEALYAAAQQGEFKEMLAAQFARQSRRGLSMSDLREIAGNIGMDPEMLASRLNQDIFLPRVRKQLKIAGQIGVTSVPTVLINGHFVAGPRTPECLGAMIEVFAENS